MKSFGEQIETLLRRGYRRPAARAKVAHDAILLAIAKSGLKTSSTIKGGVVMSHVTADVRRTTMDMDIAKARFRLATEGSRGWEVYRTCKSKRRYQSPEIAHKEARQMARRYGKPMGAYYCKFCCGYHLTSKARHQNRPELVSLEVAA